MVVRARHDSTRWDLGTDSTSIFIMYYIEVRNSNETKFN